MVNMKRVNILKKAPKNKGPVVYWMSRDHRIKDNWALLYAQEQAIKNKQPLIIIFNLLRNFDHARFEFFDFMLKGLKDIKSRLSKLNIPFIIFEGDPVKNIPKFISDYQISQLISDFSPLKIKKVWNEAIANQINIPFHEVDAHNIIPVWITSNKKEYAASTIRKKIIKQLQIYLDSFPPLQEQKHLWNENMEDKHWKIPETNDNLARNPNLNLRFKPGEEEAHRALFDFITKKLSSYNTVLR